MDNNLRNYTIALDEKYNKRVIISRANLSELLNFLANKGYLKLKKTGKDLDDLVDEFEDLAEY